MKSAHKIHKLLSVLLCCVLVLGLLPVTAFADETPTDMIAALQDLNAATTLPASFDYELGSEGLYTAIDNYGTPRTVYAKLLKVVLDEPAALDVSFAEQDGYYVDTTLWFFEKSGDTLALSTRRDNDNLNGHGEHAVIALDAGTYYIALAGYSSNSTGLCHGEISTVPVADLAESLKALDEATTLPAGFDYALGSEGLYAYTTPYGDPWLGYAKLLKVEAAAGTVLTASFAPKDACIGTGLYLFREEEDGSITQITGGYLTLAHPIEEAGTYYIALMGYDALSTGLCHAEISAVAPNYSETLDFTGDSAPTPEVGDLWSWDAGTKTLTLKNGFTLLSRDDDAICLPDGATIVVEGEANIIAEAGIIGYGDLTIKGGEAENPRLTVVSNVGIVAYGDTVIEDCGLTVNAYGPGVRSSGSLTVSGSDLDIISVYDNGIYVYGDTEIEDSDVYGDTVIEDSDLTITARRCGIYSDGSITVSGSTLDVISYNYEGIYSENGLAVSGSTLNIYSEYDDGIDAYGDTEIEDSELTINACYDGIYSENDLTVSGSTLNIYSEYGDGIDAYGDTVIEDSDLTINAGWDGIYSYGSVTVTGSTLDILSYDDGIYADGDTEIEDSDVYGDTVIEDSELTINAGWDGIYSYGSVTVTGSTLDILSYDDGIDADGDTEIADSELTINAGWYGIYSDGRITVSGGSLVVAAGGYTLDGSEISLSDVVFDLCTAGYDGLLVYVDDMEDFSLPGLFRLYDIDGNKLYEGEWTEDLLSGEEFSIADVVRAVSGHGHDWSEEWTSDENYHWHECTGEYCDVTDNAEKDGYGAHEAVIINAVSATETTDGYTGDTVCKVCNALLKKGEVIPATGKATDPTQPETEPTQPAPEPTQPAPQPSDNPETGDSGNLLLFTALLLVSCAGAAVTATYSRKRKNSAE